MTTRKGVIARVVILTTLLILVTGFLASSTLHRAAEPAVAAELLKFNIPAVTHGFQKTSQLPDGDLFLLPKPMVMAVSDAPEGARVFPVSVDSFGGDAESIGALATTAPQGLALSSSNTKVRAITCSESIWDGNILIGSTPGSTDGDTVRLFLEYPDGTEGPEVALFTVRNPGVIISELHPHIMLFVNNRKATGPSLHEGDFIPFSQAAGATGYRTDLITLAWPMGIFSPLQGCFRVVVEITRGDNPGTTSVVFTDIVVNRNRAPGDEDNPGFGLLARLTGGYPTGLPCKAECPFPPPPDPNLPNPGGPGGDDCNAICFRSPQYFRLNLGRLPHGTVLVGGMNHNRPISTTDKRAMALALRGGFTPLQQLNQEFVAAQLNLLNAGGDGSPKVYHAMEGRIECYGLKFDSVSLSNGFSISPDTKLKDLFQQARFCIYDNRADDMLALARIFDMLNGNSSLSNCNRFSASSSPVRDLPRSIFEARIFVGR